MTLHSWLKQKRASSGCSKHSTSGVNAGYSTSILAKQKLFTPDKSHILEPVLNSNVALQKYKLYFDESGMTNT